MTSEEERIMGELIQEHVLGRKTVGDLVDAKKAISPGTIQPLKW